MPPADLRRLVEIISGNASHDGGTVGPAATYRALELVTVRDLYITRQFVEDHAAEAEHAVRQALDQGASVEQVSRFAAAALVARRDGCIASVPATGRRRRGRAGA